MAYKQQLQGFRKEIRRSQLDEIFQTRRIKLLEQLKESMETEETQYLKKSELNKHELHCLAKLSQTERGIDIINQAKYSQHLLKYISSQFVDTDEQLYATYALCNLSFKSTSVPSQVMFASILSLLEEVDNQTVTDNLLCILANTMCDYKETKRQLVQNHELPKRLIGIVFRLSDPNIPVCRAVSTCIIQMLNTATADQSYLRLRQLLLRFLNIAPSPQTIIIIKQSAFSLYLLAKMFPSQLIDTIVKGDVFGKLLQLYQKLGDLPFISFIIKIANAILRQLKPDVFRTLILPVLDYVEMVNFQTHKTSGINGRCLRLQTYKLLNAAMEQCKLRQSDFMMSQLGKRLLAAFEFEEDQQLRRQLVFVFTPVYVQIKDEACRMAIDRALHRARQMDIANFQLAAHLQQLLRSPRN